VAAFAEEEKKGRGKERKRREKKEKGRGKASARSPGGHPVSLLPRHTCITEKRGGEGERYFFLKRGGGVPVGFFGGCVGRPSFHHLLSPKGKGERREKGRGITEGAGTGQGLGFHVTFLLIPLPFLLPPLWPKGRKEREEEK